MTFNIKQTTQNYIEHINKLNDKLLNYAEKVKFEKISLTEAIQEGKLSDKIGNLENTIYFILIINSNSDIATKICKHIASLKKKNKKIKYPRVNKVQKDTLNNILYIGKSKGKLQTRFKSHLTDASKSTYALHLSTWINDKKFQDLDLELYYAHVPLEDDDIQTDILEILESGLHLQGKPLLGRSGH